MPQTQICLDEDERASTDDTYAGCGCTDGCSPGRYMLSPRVLRQTLNPKPQTPNPKPCRTRVTGGQAAMSYACFVLCLHQRLSCAATLCSQRRISISFFLAEMTCISLRLLVLLYPYAATRQIKTSLGLLVPWLVVCLHQRLSSETPNPEYPPQTVHKHNPTP
jgi:hypothetical protein